MTPAQAFETYGSKAAAARAMNIPVSTFKDRLRREARAPRLPDLTAIETMAIDLIDCIASRTAEYDAINQSLKKMGGDFSTRIPAMDETIETMVVQFVDRVLGLGDIASYYLYECVGPHGHGGGIRCCADGNRVHMLRNAADLKRYVRHAKVCPGTKGCAA